MAKLGDVISNQMKVLAWVHAVGSALPLEQEGITGVMYGTAREEPGTESSSHGNPNVPMLLPIG